MNDKCERCGTPLLLVQGFGLDGWWERIGTKTDDGSAVHVEHTPARCTDARGKNVGTGCPTVDTR